MTRFQSSLPFFYLCSDCLDHSEHISYKSTPRTSICSSVSHTFHHSFSGSNERYFSAFECLYSWVTPSYCPHLIAHDILVNAVSNTIEALSWSALTLSCIIYLLANFMSALSACNGYTKSIAAWKLLANEIKFKDEVETWKWEKVYKMKVRSQLHGYIQKILHVFIEPGSALLLSILLLLNVAECTFLQCHVNNNSILYSCRQRQNMIKWRVEQLENPPVKQHLTKVFHSV